MLLEGKLKFEKMKKFRSKKGDEYEIPVFFDKHNSDIWEFFCNDEMKNKIKQFKENEMCKVQLEITEHQGKTYKNLIKIESDERAQPGPGRQEKVS